MANLLDIQFVAFLRQSFRYWLRKLTQILGVDSLVLTSHSFRRGGASTMLHQGVTFGNIAVHGRWASESSCREYLRRGNSLYCE